jgi:SAM-dependent methyltransferase
MNDRSVIFASKIDSNRLEKAYLTSRKKEGWFYDDENVKELPYAGFPSEQAKIWSWRRHSLSRLVSHLREAFGKRQFSLLDVGCGNGWMTNYLACKLPSAQLFGVDVNIVELEQANRVFSKPNLKFGYADILSEDLPAKSFDIIVLAGSAQYFADLNILQRSLLRLLTADGEAHIIDTNFYRDSQSRNLAKLASEDYFNKQDTPEMIPFYHHHLLSDWKGIDLNDSWLIKIQQKIGILSPFPWLCLKAAS